MKRKCTFTQTFELPWWRKQASILNAPLASRLATTILNAALVHVCFTMGACVTYIHDFYMTLTSISKFIFSPWIYVWERSFALGHTHTKLAHRCFTMKEHVVYILDLLMTSPLFWFLCPGLLFLYITMATAEIKSINKVSTITMTAMIVGERWESSRGELEL